MKRQRIDWVGEETRCDQTFIFAIADRSPSISDLHMRNSVLSTVQTVERPIADSSSVISDVPAKFRILHFNGGF